MLLRASLTALLPLSVAIFSLAAAGSHSAPDFWVYVVTRHEILLIDGETGELALTVPIGTTYRPVLGSMPTGLERPLTYDPSSGRLFVLDLDPDGDNDLRNSVGIRVFDTLRQEMKVTHVLPTPLQESIRWNNLALSAKGKVLYVLGYRLANPGVDFTEEEYEMKVLAVETDSGSLIHSYALFPTGTVYQAAVDFADRALYISYHGKCTGIDILDLSTGEFLARPCTSNRGLAYIRAHGGVVRGPDGRIYTPSDGGAVLLAIYPGSRQVVEEFETGLGESTHMPEMAPSPTEDVLYLLGTCSYDMSKKLFELNVRSGDFREIARGTVCGERLAVSADGRFIVALRTQGGISMLHAQSGEVLWDRPLDAQALDAAVVPRVSSTLPVTGEEMPLSILALGVSGGLLILLGMGLRRMTRKRAGL